MSICTTNGQTCSATTGGSSTASSFVLHDGSTTCVFGSLDGATLVVGDTGCPQRHDTSGVITSNDPTGTFHSIQRTTEIVTVSGNPSTGTHARQYRDESGLRGAKGFDYSASAFFFADSVGVARVLIDAESGVRSLRPASGTIMDVGTSAAPMRNVNLTGSLSFVNSGINSAAGSPVGLTSGSVGDVRADTSNGALWVARVSGTTGWVDTVASRQRLRAVMVTGGVTSNRFFDWANGSGPLTSLTIFSTIVPDKDGFIEAIKIRSTTAVTCTVRVYRNGSIVFTETGVSLSANDTDVVEPNTTFAGSSQDEIGIAVQTTSGSAGTYTIEQMTFRYYEDTSRGI